ncbi:uncharacterized protein AB9W97_009932 isoform 2-T6 [Spinachia spinachia]
MELPLQGSLKDTRRGLEPRAGSDSRSLAHHPTAHLVYGGEPGLPQGLRDRAHPPHMLRLHGAVYDDIIQVGGSICSMETQHPVHEALKSGKYGELLPSSQILRKPMSTIVPVTAMELTYARFVQGHTETATE